MTQPDSIIYLSLMQITILVYLLKTILLVKQKNQSLKGYYSSLEKINYDWLKLVVSAFLIMWIVASLTGLQAAWGCTPMTFYRNCLVSFPILSTLCLQSTYPEKSSPSRNTDCYLKMSRVKNHH